MRQVACCVLLLVSSSFAQEIEGPQLDRTDPVTFEFQEAARNFLRFQHAVGDPLKQYWTNEELASVLQTEQLEREQAASELMDEATSIRSQIRQSSELKQKYYRLVVSCSKDYPGTRAATEADKILSREDINFCKWCGQMGSTHYRFGFYCMTR